METEHLLKVLKVARRDLCKYSNTGKADGRSLNRDGYLKSLHRVDGLIKALKTPKAPVTMIHGKPFKCDCGCQVLEEIMGGVTHTSTILNVGDSGDAVYGHSSQDGGEVESIQCAACGKKYAESTEELAKKFKK